MNLRDPRRGLGRVEVIVAIACVAGLIALVLPVLHKARCGASSLKDKTQIQQVFKGSVAWNADHNTRMPTPSVVSSQTGPDYSQNHSAPLYSMLVMSVHVRPELLVSSRECIEVNKAIRVKDDYDFSGYNPAASVFWDSTFTMRIDDPKFGANCSYSHRTLCGERLESSGWRSTSSAGAAMFGTRGTRGGATEGPEYTRSPTLRLHGPETAWYGHVCFGDGHIETLDTFFPPLSVFKPDGSDSPIKDNIFAAEFSHPHGNQAAGDNFLSIAKGSTEFTVQDIYDPLE